MLSPPVLLMTWVIVPTAPSETVALLLYVIRGAGAAPLSVIRGTGAAPAASQ